MSTFDRGLRSLFVNFIRLFRGVRQNRHLVPQHFHEPAGNHQELFSPVFPNSQLTGLQRGHQGRMMGQNAQLSLNTWGHHSVNFIGIHLALSSDNFQSYGRHTLLLSHRRL